MEFIVNNIIFNVDVFGKNIWLAVIGVKYYRFIIVL